MRGLLIGLWLGACVHLTWAQRVHWSGQAASDQGVTIAVQGKLRATAESVQGVLHCRSLSPNGRCLGRRLKLSLQTDGHTFVASLQLPHGILCRATGLATPGVAEFAGRYDCVRGGVTLDTGNFFLREG